MNKQIENSEDKFWKVISRPNRLSSKLGALGILFILVYVRIFDAFIKSPRPTISEETYLFVSIIIVVYIWVVESIDSQKRLLSANELINLRARLREEQTNTISSLILFQEAKDPYTRGHTLRVTKYSTLLAQRLNLREDDAETLRRAALLHDIGKIGISDLLLCKKEKLSELEMETIRKHAILGEDILEPLEFLKKERKLVSQHHEHFDGSGYPRGLRGEDILFGARVLAICDFFDAVSSDRPYRKALKESEITEELQKNRGKQFDPKLADLMLILIKDERGNLRKIAESER